MNWFTKWFSQSQPLNAADYDLSHFNWVKWGRRFPNDAGDHGRVLLYKDQIVYSSTHRTYSGGPFDEVTGNEDILFIAQVAQAYQNIYAAVRKLGVAFPNAPDVPLGTFLSTEVAYTLLDHPQYRQLVAATLGSGWQIRLVLRTKDVMEAVCLLR